MDLNSNELDIIGLTTVFGNVAVDLTTTNALRLLDLAQRSDIPVAKGAENPLDGTFSGGVPFVHGDDGQGNTWSSPSGNSPIASFAPDFLIEKILAHPGEVTIATLGPLTNLAIALDKEPRIQRMVKEIVVMGGNAFCWGNATPAAEANMYSDPVAADRVLGGHWPVTMVSLDVTHKTLLSKDDILDISTFDSPLNNHVMEAYKFYQAFFRKVNKIEGTYLHDGSAILYLLDRNPYTLGRYPVRVEAAECFGKGKVWPSEGTSDHEENLAVIPWRNRPLVNICVDVRAKEVIELVKKRLVL